VDPRIVASLTFVSELFALRELRLIIQLFSAMFGVFIPVGVICDGIGCWFCGRLVRPLGYFTILLGLICGWLLSLGIVAMLAYPDEARHVAYWQ
jgi:hypothetical protein